jgi:hypothetical protein
MGDIPEKNWYSSIMIKKPEILKQFDEQFISSQGRVSYEQSRCLFSAMWREGVTLGVLPPADPLEGIEVDIHIARILNSCLTKPSSE